MLKPASSPPRIATLIILTAISLLSLNMFLPALPQMADDFAVEYAVMNMAIAGYLASAGVMQLFFGPLSDRYGRRLVLFVSMGIFLVASVGGLLATNAYAFLAFRFLQSAVIAGMVVSRAIIRDITSEEEAASLLGYVAMVMALAPMLGPTLGGFMTGIIGWRSIYMLYSALGLLAMLLIWVDVGETNKTQSTTIGAQFREYPELFRSRRFWGYTFGLSFSVSAFYGFISGAPLVALEYFDLSAALLGTGIGSISGGYVVGNYLSGKFTHKIGLKRMMALGRYAALVGPLIALIISIAGVTNLFVYFGGVILVGFGNGLTLPGANVGVMSVRPKLAGSAAGISGAMTIATGAVITWLVGVVLSLGNALIIHLSVISLCALLGLLAFVYVDWIDHKEGPPKEM